MVFERSKRLTKYQPDLILASDVFKRNYDTEINLEIEL